MGWEDTIQDKPFVADTTPEATPSSWEDSIQDAPHESSTWDALKGTGNFSEQASSFGTGLAKGAFLPVKIVDSILPGQTDPNLRQSLMAVVEKVLGENLGDDQSKALYKGLSLDEIKKRNVGQEEATLAKAPIAGMAGELVGSAPAMIAAGGAVGAAGETAAGLSKAPVISKLAQLGTEAAGWGAVGEGMGMAASNAPTARERATEALPTAGISAAFPIVGTGAGLASKFAGSPIQKGITALTEKAAPVIGPIASTLGKVASTGVKYGGSALAGGVALPLLTGSLPGANLRTVEGLAAGVFGPHLLKTTGPGQMLTESYQYGKNGVKLFSPQDIKRVSNQAEALANQVGKEVGVLESGIGKSAAEKIVQNTNKVLEDATSMNVQTHNEMGNKLTNHLEKLQTTLEQPAIREIDQALTDFTKKIGQEFKLTSDAEFTLLRKIKDNAGEKVGELWQVAEETGQQFEIMDAIQAARDSVKETSLMLAPQEEAAAEKLALNFEKFLFKPENPYKEIVNEVQNVKGMKNFNTKSTTFIGLNKPNIPMVPGEAVGIKSPTTLKPPMMREQVTQFPLSVSTPEIKSQTTSYLAEPRIAKTFLDANETRKLINMTADWAYNMPSAGPALNSLTKGIYKNLKAAIYPSFELPTIGPVSNPLKMNDKIYTNVLKLFKEIGDPQLDLVSKDWLTPDKFGKLIKTVEKAAAEGDTGKLDRINSLMSNISPDLKNHFEDIILPFIRQKNQLISVKNSPILEKAAALPQTPQIQQAVSGITDVNALRQQLRPPVQIGEELMAPTGTKTFVNKMANPQANPEVEAVLKLISERDATLANEIRQQIPTLQAGIAEEAALTNVAKLAPEEQTAQLATMGKPISPEVQQATQQATDISKLTKTFGTPDSVEGNAPTGSQKFVENLFKIDSSDKGRDIEGTLKLLERYNPELAQKLRTAGVDISRQGELQGEVQTNLPFFLGLGPLIRGSAGRSANVLGRAMGSIETAASNGLSQLKQLIETSPQMFGQFAEPLKVANQRGLPALAAQSYALYSRDSEYRAMIDKLQEESEKADKGQ